MYKDLECFGISNFSFLQLIHTPFIHFGFFIFLESLCYSGVCGKASFKDRERKIEGFLWRDFVFYLFPLIIISLLFFFFASFIQTREK